MVAIPASRAAAGLMCLALLTHAPKVMAESYHYVHQWGTYGSGNGQFNNPIYMASDSTGNIYVVDYLNHRVEKFDRDGTFISKWGSLGSGNGQFDNPECIVVDSDSHVLVVDNFNSRVQKFTTDGVYLSQWGTAGSGDGQFNTPVGIALDAAGNIYVTELFGNRVQKFDHNGNYLSKWGSSGTGNGQFNEAAGIVVGSDGSVYVADRRNHRVQKFTSGGTYDSQWGTYGTGVGEFQLPGGLAIDQDDNIYVTEGDGNRVQKFDRDGHFVTLWGETGYEFGKFRGPLGILVHQAGNVAYVADSQNNRVQQFAQSVDTLGTAPRALSFDGNDFVSITPPPSLDFSSNSHFTIELWFMPDGQRSIYHILGPISRGNVLLSYIAYPEADIVSTGFDPPPNVWSHVAVTYGSHVMKIYVNGILRVATPYSNINADSFLPFAIAGGDHTPASQLFTGLIDEVRVWNVVRTDQEIGCYFNRTVNPETPGLLGYWHMDEAGGQVVTDSSPFRRHGVLGADTAVRVDDPTRVTSVAPIVETDHDVALEEVIAPGPTVWLGSITVPSVIVHNLGSHTDEVTVNLRIGALYSESAVASLAPAESRVIQFPAWAAELSGSFGIMCSVTIAGDACTTNNSGSSIVSVVTDPTGPTILNAIPRAGGNRGYALIVLTGAGFEDGAEVSLEMGSSAIVSDQVAMEPDGRSLTARFDLTGRSLGDWDIVVSNPDGSRAIFREGFSVESVRPPELRVDILGRIAIRAGLPQSYPVLCTNLGNVESPLAAVWIRGIPVDADLGVSLGPITLPFPVAPGDSVPHPEIVELPTEKVVAVLVQPLRIGTTAALTLTITSPTLQSFELQAWALSVPPLDSLLSLDANAVGAAPARGARTQLCACSGDEDAIRSARVIALQRLLYGWWLNQILYGYRDLCVGAARDLASNIADASRDPNSPLYGWGVETISGDALGLTSGWHNAVRLTSRTNCKYLIDNYVNPFIDLCLMSNDGHSISSACGIWACPIQKWFNWTLVASYAAAGDPVRSQGRPVVDQIGLNDSCALPSPSGKVPVQVTGSLDPNEKSGSSGFGEPRYVLGGGVLPYEVLFENQATASAAAREIVVTDRLDPSLYDLSALSLGPVTIAGRQFMPPAGSKALAADFDLRPGREVIARLQAGLSPGTGVLTWSLSTIDPNTGLPPDDPTAGFLPPNMLPPEGEGSVLFNVNAKDVLATGTEIRNQAAIRFDANQTMLTPEWLNTVDGTPPISSLGRATPVGTGDSTFVIRWIGDDSESGVRDFSIFVAEGAGPYNPLLLNTAEREVTFHVQSGTYYMFYSVARDSAGNVEDAPAVPDLILSTTAGVNPDPSLPQFSLEGARPNPAGRGLIVAFSLPSRGEAALEVLDICGRLILTQDVGSLGQGSHVVSLGATRDIASGIYLLRLTAGGRSIAKKALVLRN